jgi:hypothetical protein
MRHSCFRNWTNEFEDIDFGDQRLNTRMIGLAAAFGDSFSKPLNPGVMPMTSDYQPQESYQDISV